MVGNKLLTILSNMFTNLNLTDKVGYKVFRISYKKHRVRGKRFDLPKLQLKFRKGI